MSEMREIVNYFKTKGFKITKDENENSYSTEDEHLRIGIFGYDYPNENYCGKILAEHKDNFDKWSKAFYSCSLPSSEEEIEILLSDLKYITTDENKEAGDCFGKLRRTF